MNRISFTVNGIKCHVGCDISSDVSLLDYIRNYLELRGTKYMCREGGCGACLVHVVKSPGGASSAVNSCLVSVMSCYGWDITTIEKLGNRKNDYHSIQKALAQGNGSQCGYCSPGWVMAMYSVLLNNKNLTQLEIEKSFASNICRCTGYRPILEAFKRFAKDTLKPARITDIEDLQICKKTGAACGKTHCDEDDDWCFVNSDTLSNIIEIELKDGKTWYRVTTVRDIYDIIKNKDVNSYMLVSGNSAKGVYPINEYPSSLIDVSGVSELKGFLIDQNLVIKANTTLSELIQIFDDVSKKDDFHYLKAFYDHLQLVANLPVRSIASIAGNLMTKHKHNEFTSDLFLLFIAVDAQLTIGEYPGAQTTVSMKQFLNVDMRGKVILKIALPPLNDDENTIVTYKIMPRAQNAHAIVNACFIYKMKSNDIVTNSKIVYSGLIPPYTRAVVTERFLLGRKLFTNETLQGAVKILERELVATVNPPEPSTTYRKKLATGLFYKSILALCPPEKLHTRYRSGATNLRATRPVSKGEQNFETNSLIYPLTQPLQKVEAMVQCAGEALYTEDIPAFPHEVFAAFVLATEGSGNIVNIDASKALSVPGVLAFYSAKDIPGLNSFTPAEHVFYTSNEEVFSNGDIHYYNQPIGVVVAETRSLAERAAKMVNVTYKNVKRPIIEMAEAIKDKSRVTQFITIPAADKGRDTVQVIKGENVMRHQYHFSMETLVCVTNPSEQGLEVHCSSQWVNGVQAMISRALNMDANSIDVYIPRVGGAYGLKISRQVQVAVAASLVAKKLNRPCRIINSLTTNMRAVGKRAPSLFQYEVGINKSGIIQYVDHKHYEDEGYMSNEQLYLFVVDAFPNAYKKSNWAFTGSYVLTDTHKNTWCRSPGTFESISTAEFIMEQISYEASLDPVEVRLANVDTNQYNELIEMYQKLKADSNYVERKAAVQKFNAENRWKKRGLRVAFMRWTPVSTYRLNISMSVYFNDGTVVITHSGIEMGQGMNTKAVQVAAYILKIPVEKIKIKNNNSIIGPNGNITGGSIGTQNVTVGVKRCCEQLLERLKPIRDKMPLATWEEIIKNAFESHINLQTNAFVNQDDEELYNVCGVCFAEVEVDVLTGEHEIIRVDLIEDPGRSINPELDIGQVEGAFLMGVGFWTSEHIAFDRQSGEILTDRTWNYHVPQARDIPQDSRIYFTNKYPSSDKIFGAKAVGEPPLCLSVAVPFSIREAIVSARLDSGLQPNKWFSIDGAYTLENICLATSTKTDDFKLY